MSLRKLVRILSVTGLLLAGAAAPDQTAAGERLQQFARWAGFGWSDGYHTCPSGYCGSGNRAAPHRSAPGQASGSRVAPMASPGCAPCAASTSTARQSADGRLRSESPTAVALRTISDRVYGSDEEAQPEELNARAAGSALPSGASPEQAVLLESDYWEGLMAPPVGRSPVLELDSIEPPTPPPAPRQP